MAKCVEELPVWQRALELAEAVFAMTEGRRFLRHPRLVEQLNDAADSMLSNIAEGFAQPTDRAFARYLGIAQGSCDEIRSHLAVAVMRRCAEADAAAVLRERSHEISRMLNGFSQYLLRCDRTRRGR